MTLREAMLTLNDEAGAMDTPGTLHMGRMLDRLADLKSQLQVAQNGPIRWGPWMLGEIRGDIGRQLAAIVRAVRINPALREMADAAGVELPS